MNSSLIESEEINLFGIIKEIYKNRFKIITLAILLSTALIILIYQGYTRNYTISFDIKKISELEERNYDSLNNLSLLDKYELNNSKSSLINADMLLEETIIEIRNNFVNVYLSNYDSFMNKLDNNLKIKASERAKQSLKITKSKNDDYMTVIYDTKYPLNSEIFIASLFDTSHKNVAKKVKKYVNNLKSNLEFEKTVEIESLEARINVAKFKYLLNLSQKKEQLIEQASIAREIGIEIGDLTDMSMNIISNDAQSDIGGTNPNRLNEFELPIYYRGYKAIEKEISIIDDKLLSSNPELFVEEIPDLKAKIELLSNKTDIILIQTAINKTPIGKESFLASSLKSFNGIVSSSPSPLMLYILVVILSIFGSIILILFYSSYNNYNSIK